MLYLILLKSLLFDNIACDGFFKGRAQKKNQTNSGLLPNPPLTPNLQFDFLGKNKILHVFFSPLFFFIFVFLESVWHRGPNSSTYFDG